MCVFPRTLLLTSWPPDGHYAGAEAMRRLLRALPRDRVLWCSLKPRQGPLSADLPEHKAFLVRSLHWRFRNSLLNYAWEFDGQAPWLARRVAAESRAFAPEVIWVLPELLAIPVAYHLARLLNLPLHATVYDTPESAGDICIPRRYFGRYMVHVNRLFGALSSVDTVSMELLGYVQRYREKGSPLQGVALPPSVPSAWMHPPRRECPWPDETRRVIGFCGSFRVTEDQWGRWLSLLGSLPWRIDLLAFASPDTVPKADLPANVSWRFLPYVEDEREIVDCFVREKVQACYLGLRRSPQWVQFNRTSLSSKLMTYAAAGVPIIVDAPEDSVAWRLVRQNGAGIWIEDGAQTVSLIYDPDVAPICDRPKEQDRTQCGATLKRDAPARGNSSLQQLLSDEAVWRAMALGAARMCAAEFDLGVNAEKMTMLLAQTAAAKMRPFTAQCSTDL